MLRQHKYIIVEVYSLNSRSYFLSLVDYLENADALLMLLALGPWRISGPAPSPNPNPIQSICGETIEYKASVTEK